MHCGEYSNCSDAESNEDEASFEKEALHVIRQFRPPKYDQVMAVKREADGRPVSKSPRFVEGRQVPSKALLYEQAKIHQPRRKKKRIA